jgi:branched-chain amino acid transport system ATP-binding protein
LAPAMLAADGLVSGYGRIRILDGVSISLSAGEVVAVIGHNGMGKTTLLRTLMGLLRAKGGTIHLAGRDITRRETAMRSRLGLGYVPQGRQIFPDLSVLENLQIGEAARAGRSDIPAMFERFPVLAELREPGPSGIRHIGGANLNWALVRNVRTYTAMPREKAQRSSDEAE